MGIEQIRKNPLYQKITDAQILGPDEETWRGNLPGYEKEMEWYKLQTDRLKEFKENLKKGRNELLMTDREIVKFGVGAKAFNPITMDEAAPHLAQMGYPLPQGTPLTKQRSLAQHLKLIEDSVISGRDLPPAQLQVQYGFDPQWLNANWPQYRDFYRKRLEDAVIKTTYGGIRTAGETAKKLAELMTRFLF
jgi:hypothetical protein